MPCVSLCPKQNSADLVQEGLTKITAYCEHLEKTIKELQEELAKYEEDPSKLCATMDDHVENYLDDQGISLSLEELCEAYHDLKTSLQTTENYWKSKFEAVEQSTESSAYQEEEIKRLQEENEVLKKENKLMMVEHTKILKRRKWDQSERDKLRNENKELQKKIDDMESEVLDGDAFLCGVQKQTEQVYYHGEPLMCIEDGTPITISDVFPNKFIKENKELQKEVSRHRLMAGNLDEENKELKEKNKSLNNDILEIGAELNKRCSGEIMFHQNSDGDNFLVEIHK